jgi:hypothetical protein
MAIHFELVEKIGLDEVGVEVHYRTIFVDPLGNIIFDTVLKATKYKFGPVIIRPESEEQIPHKLHNMVVTRLKDLIRNTNFNQNFIPPTPPPSLS